MQTIELMADSANPNRMEAEDLARMDKALAEFGDLGGIVYNRRTGLLIGGHQRVSLLGSGAEVEDLPEPEPDGTVARGHVERGGVRYAVRVVDWDEAKAHAALLAANRFGRVGGDDERLLSELLMELQREGVDQELAGYSTEELERLIGSFDVQAVEEPELREGDREPFRQVSFQLHDSQFETVEAAIEKAQKSGGGKSDVNENKNGNAIAFICAAFMCGGCKNG